MDKTEAEVARSRAAELLGACRVATICTSADDRPWASTVFYAEDGFTLYVNKPITTTMLRNMLANPRVAYTVDRGEPTLFLQGAGHAEVVAEAGEAERARRLLAAKVPEAHVGGGGFTLVRIVSDEVYLTEGRAPRVRIALTAPPEAPAEPHAIAVDFVLPEATYEATLDPGQIIHEALEAALPPEVRTNHRLQFRTPAGREVFADHFARDVAGPDGRITLLVRATAVPAPAGAPDAFTNYGFDHLAIVVADRPGARDFLQHALGLKLVRDDAHQTVLTSGPTAIFLFDARPGIPMSEPVPSRWHHLGFVVDDLEAALWRVRGHARDVSSDFILLERNERWSLYLHYTNGPARLMIQLSEIKANSRGFADPHAFADHMYDYGAGPYGAPARG